MEEKKIDYVEAARAVLEDMGIKAPEAGENMEIIVEDD